MTSEKKEKSLLLNANGSLANPGWSKKLIYEYSPYDVKAHKSRIKEWDYYIVIDDDGHAFATVIADNRYMGLANSSFYDLNERKKYDFITPSILPMGKFNMPKTSESGDIFYRSSGCKVSYFHEKNGRRITGKYSKNLFHDELEFDIKLESNADDDTMVIATPWATDDKAFYYNQKINCMRASGYVKFSDKTFTFSPDKAYATLDWGRGVWTYDNTWYWGSGNATINGKRFGYNIGYGFGDTRAASENMIFYDGKCHKLDLVRFEIPDNIMAPWKIISSDGRFDMTFNPVFDNRTNINALIISQDAHQVFGKISGKAVLDDGTVLELKDLMVFNEKVRNRY